MNFKIIFIGLLSVSGYNWNVKADSSSLRCDQFYVKIFNTATRSIEYTCQEYVPWSEEDDVLCTDQKKMPYVIVYSSANSTAQITYYKLCCRTKECLDKYPFNPMRRFGKNIPYVRNIKPLFQTDVGYLDVFVQILVTSVFFLGVAYIVFHILYIRHHVATKWNDEQEELDPELLEWAEMPKMHIVKMGHKDDDGISISGQHSFLDYCRIIASCAARDRRIRNSQLIDPELVNFRILRHDLRKIREMREFNVTKWKYVNNRLNRNERFVKIGPKWVYVSKNMQRNGFVERQLLIDQRAAIQRWTDAIKMYQKLKTKTRYETTKLKHFDRYDVGYLISLGMESKEMHMMFFNSVGLGHELFRAKPPIGHVQHNNEFEAMFFFGPYFYPWNPVELIALFEKAKERFLEDDICLKLSLPIVIIGEIRGRYADLHRWLQITGLPYRRKLLFLGGYTERGTSHYQEYGIECLSFIAALKVAYPRHVFMLRGSAETTFSFASRFTVPMDDAVLSSARQMCNCLPLTALINEDYLAIPSGISPFMMEDLFWLESIERPLRPEKIPYNVRWLLFGQPNTMTGHFEYDEEKQTFRYGLRAVEKLRQKYELKSIIRSRNELPINPLFFNDHAFITISSTPTEQSGGVAMLIDENHGWFFFKLRFQTDPLTFDPDPHKHCSIDETKSDSKTKET